MTSELTSGRHGLRAGQKLHTAAEFDRARKGRERHGDAFFLVQGAPNDRGEARLGMAVGVRAIGGAVPRNRLRRLIRESFRNVKIATPPRRRNAAPGKAARIVSPGWQ